MAFCRCSLRRWDQFELTFGGANQNPSTPRGDVADNDLDKFGSEPYKIELQDAVSGRPMLSSLLGVFGYGQELPTIDKGADHANCSPLLRLTREVVRKSFDPN